uniref:Zinc finger protein 527 n=1 Tax=Cacopsylla melanoneura TaxID=428564 RepID=A0A8D9AT90_9HEMI
MPVDRYFNCVKHKPHFTHLTCLHWEYKHMEQQQQQQQKGEGNNSSSEGQQRTGGGGGEHNVVKTEKMERMEEEEGDDQEQRGGEEYRSGGGEGTTSWEKVSRDLSAYAVERPYTCDYCNKCFKQEAHLKQHVRIHTDDRPYGCTYCGKAFRQKAVLNQHVRLHTGEKPYTCAHCAERFRQMTTLKLHMRKHLCEAISSGNYTSPVFGSAQYKDIVKLMGQKGAVVPPGGELTNQQAANALSQHIQQMQQQNGSHMGRGPGRPRGSINPSQHTGDMNLYYVERPHACKFCSKCFKQEAHLKLHIRTHSDYRPFACTYCGKCFRLKAILNQHLRLHTGEKPYECETCGEKFRQMTTLKLHMRKHLAEVALSGGQLANQAEYAEVIGLIQKGDAGGDGERARAEVAHSQGQGPAVVVVQVGQSSESGDGVNIQ